MAARLEFLLGPSALGAAGLTLTALYLRTEVRKEQAKRGEYRSIGLPSP